MKKEGIAHSKLGKDPTSLWGGPANKKTAKCYERLTSVREKYKEDETANWPNLERRAFSQRGKKKGGGPYC